MFKNYYLERLLTWKLSSFYNKLKKALRLGKKLFIYENLDKNNFK